MAVSAVLRLAQWHEPHPSEPRYPLPYTGGTPVPLSKSPKAIAFWYEILVIQYLSAVFLLFAKTFSSTGRRWSCNSLVLIITSRAYLPNPLNHSA
jgi:hypothetical protein